MSKNTKSNQKSDFYSSHAPIPPLLSKKWLTSYYDISLKVLKSRVFTIDVLNDIGMTPEQYRVRRTFPLDESDKIKARLNIN